MPKLNTNRRTASARKGAQQARVARWNTIEGLEARDIASLLSPESHKDTLTVLAATLLQQSRHRSAFLLADRRCRIDIPSPEHLLLRADASKALGEDAQALSDVKSALEIDPDHVLALRRALSWGAKKDRADAAIRLIGCEDDIGSLIKAIRVATESRLDGLALFKRAGRGIQGWMAWRGPPELVLHVLAEGEENRLRVRADPRHPLREALLHAASVEFERPSGPTSAELRISERSILILGTPVRFAPQAPPTVNTQSKPRQWLKSGGISVIVPVYEDAAATSACLNSVLADRAELPREVIVVDDHSPNRSIKQSLKKLAERAAIRLITHSVNQGFVASVNHALAARAYQDVILLNSDTVVPPGALDRLMQAMRSSPDIATATPLSNNGEFTSFPKAFTRNDLPGGKEIARIDALAARVNRLQAIDIPNGIGFCMAVRGECVEHLGGFETAVELGYLEDVDFCLRAAEAGYRNVCATGVYVGHAGTRSFGERKRSLVMRNMPLIENRYPRYRSSCGAFMRIDPLRPARARIEEAWLVDRPQRVQAVIVGQRPQGHPVHNRLQHLERSGAPVLVVESNAGANAVNVFCLDGGIPKNLTYRLNRGEDVERLMSLLERFKLERIEFADPIAVAPPLFDAFAKLKRHYEVWMSDAGIIPTEEQSNSSAGNETGARKRKAARGNGVPVKQGDAGMLFDRMAIASPWMRERLRSARKVGVAAVALARLLKRENLIGRAVVEPPFVAPARRKERSADRVGASLLGVIPLDSSTRTLQFLIDLAHGLRGQANGPELVVFGATCDDLRLLAAGNVFVSGPARQEEFRPLLSVVQPSHLLTITREAVFGHPWEAEAVASGRPLARVDWLIEKPFDFSGKDLLFSPVLGAEELASAIASWTLTARRGGRRR